MGLFRKKPSPDKIGNDLGALLVNAAVTGSRELRRMWGRDLQGEAQVSLFLELYIVLVAATDRFAFQKFGDPIRSQIMNTVMNVAQYGFSNQNHFGSTPKRRRAYFEKTCSVRLAEYAALKSIAGKGPDSLVYVASFRLTQTFVPDLDFVEYETTLVKTMELLVETLATLMTIPTFRLLID